MPNERVSMSKLKQLIALQTSNLSVRLGTCVVTPLPTTALHCRRSRSLPWLFCGCLDRPP